MANGQPQIPQAGPQEGAPAAPKPAKTTGLTSILKPLRYLSLVSLGIGLVTGTYFSIGGMTDSLAGKSMGAASLAGIVGSYAVAGPLGLIASVGAQVLGNYIPVRNEGLDGLARQGESQLSGMYNAGQDTANGVVNTLGDILSMYI